MDQFLTETWWYISSDVILDIWTYKCMPMYISRHDGLLSFWMWCSTGLVNLQSVYQCMYADMMYCWDIYYVSVDVTLITLHCILDYCTKLSGEKWYRLNSKGICVLAVYLIKGISIARNCSNCPALLACQQKAFLADSLPLLASFPGR